MSSNTTEKLYKCKWYGGSAYTGNCTCTIKPIILKVTAISKEIAHGTIIGMFQLEDLHEHFLRGKKDFRGLQRPDFIQESGQEFWHLSMGDDKFINFNIFEREFQDIETWKITELKPDTTNRVIIEKTMEIYEHY
jgi:hypothetical protein